MKHFSCDVCGKGLGDGSASRYVVRIEVYPAHEPSGLTDADLDSDPLDEIDVLLQDLDDGELENPEPASRQIRYDLCPECRSRFLKDPLNREQARFKFRFSKN